MVSALARPNPTGFLMIKEAKIRNFRCFKALDLKHLSRLNVILGRNASGKTALLEALLLPLASNPDLAQRYRAWRGLQGIISNNIDADRKSWNDLFYDLNFDNKISINLTGSDEHTRSLTISYPASEGMGGIPSQGQSVVASPVRFNYQTPKHSWEVRAIPTDKGFAYIGQEPVPPQAAFFPASQGANPNESAERLTMISRRREVEKVVKAVHDEFSFIRSFEVGTELGQSSIFVDVEGKAEKLPIGLVSGGVSKIINILLAIGANAGGVIMLDEIENGIYFDRYEALWRGIYTFAKDNSVQIFASTHSQECLDALGRVAKDWETDVSFLRTVTVNDRPTVEQFHGSTIFGAMKIGEVR